LKPSVIYQIIQKSIDTGEGQAIEALTIARDEKGDVVAEFFIN